MTFTMFCMMMAMIKYRYFGSLHAAVDNAFNHGNEGILFVAETAPILTNENTVLLGDSVRLSQVLVNLLSNAVKYMDGGLICLHAKLQAAFGQKKRLILSVTDTGIAT